MRRFSLFLAFAIVAAVPALAESPGTSGSVLTGLDGAVAALPRIAAGQPSGVTGKPTEAIEVAGDPSDEPEVESEEPGGVMEQPAEATEEPGGVSEEPEVETEEPAEVTEEPGAEQPGEATEEPEVETEGSGAVDFTGPWQSTSDNGGIYQMEFTQDSGDVTGTYESQHGRAGQISGTVSDNVFDFDWQQDGGYAGTGHFEVAEDGNSFTGTYTITQYPGKKPKRVHGAWTGERLPE